MLADIARTTEFWHITDAQAKVHQHVAQGTDKIHIARRSDGDILARATYGHSFYIPPQHLGPAVPNIPEGTIYGVQCTTREKLQMLARGMHAEPCIHIHVFKISAAPSGAKGREATVYIDVGRCLQKGFTAYEVDPNILIITGAEGYLRPEYLSAEVRGGPDNASVERTGENAAASAMICAVAKNTNMEVAYLRDTAGFLAQLLDESACQREFSDDAAARLQEAFDNDRGKPGVSGHLMQVAQAVLRVAKAPAKLQVVAVKGLGVLYSEDHTRLLEAIRGIVRCMLLPDTAARVVRKCKATLSKFLEQQPTLAKVYIEAVCQEETRQSLEGQQRVDEILRKWAQRGAIDAPVPKEEWMRILQAVGPRPATPRAPTNQLVWRAPRRNQTEVPRSNTTDTGRSTIRIAAHNVNGFRRRWERGDIQRMLRGNGADVVFLSETRCDPRDIKDYQDVEAYLRAMGYGYCHWTWNNSARGGGPGHAGCAMFSKLKPVSSKCTIEDEGDHPNPPMTDNLEGRFMTVDFGTFRAIHAYVPLSPCGLETSERRVYFDKRVHQHVEHCKRLRPEIPVIYCGDLNVTHSGKDIRFAHGVDVNATRLAGVPTCKPYELMAQARLLKEHALADAYTALGSSSGPVAHTWHRTKGMRTWSEDGTTPFPESSRIDRFLVSVSMLTAHPPHGVMATACHVLPEKYGSDHNPITLVLSVPAGSAARSTTLGTEGAPEVATARAAPEPSNEQARRRREVLQEYLAQWHRGRPERVARGARSAEEEMAEDLDDSETEGNQRDPPEPLRYEPTCLTTTMCSTSLTIGQEGSADKNLHRKCDSLLDSGAGVDLIRRSVVHEMQMPILTERLGPILRMANNARQRVTEYVVITVQHEQNSRTTHHAYVVDDCPYEYVVGRGSLKQMGAILDFEKGVVTMRPRHEDGLDRSRSTRGQQYEMPIQVVIAEHSEGAIPLFIRETITIPAGHQLLAPARASPRENVENGTWGLVFSSGKYDAQVWQPTAASTHIQLNSHANWVQVANPHDYPITLKRGACIAMFHRQNPDSFSRDVCELDAMYREWQEQQRDNEARKYEEPMCGVQAQDKEREEAKEDAETHEDESSVDRAYTEIEHLQDIELGDTNGRGDEHTNLSKQELCDLKRLVLQYHTLWHTEGVQVSKAHGVQCQLQLTGPPRPIRRSFGTNPRVRAETMRIIQEQKRKGVIRDSCSPYSSPTLLVPKPGGKGYRLCMDYRALNKVISRDAYPLPRTDTCLSTLHGADLFSSLDIVAAFWQVPMAEDSIQYTAFCTSEGQYEWTRMPMGLKVASSVFSRFIDEVMGKLKWHCVLTYIDDSLVYTRSGFDAHVQALALVLERLQEYGLAMGAAKTHLARTSVRFLGHIVSAQGIHPDPGKVKAIREMPLPQSRKELKSAMGLFSYYRRYCKNFAAVAKPLARHLSASVGWPATDDSGKAAWSKEARTAFRRLKDMLCSEPVLQHPMWSRPFTIDTDASKDGLGAVLSQCENKCERVIMYASRSLNETEAAYTIYELETKAIVWAFEVFGWYLWLSETTVRTDSNAVKHVLENAKKGRHIRWAMALQVH